MKKRALLIIPNNASSLLASISPYLVNYEVIETITCNQFLSFDLSLLMDKIQTVIIDNELYISDSVAHEMTKYFLERMKEVVLSTPLLYKYSEVNKYVQIIIKAPEYDEEGTETELPVLYISGYGAENEIILCHSLINEIFEKNGSNVLNISNSSLARDIGFIDVTDFINSKKVELTRIREEFAEFIAPELSSKDLIVLSNTEECINHMRYTSSFEAKDLFKNILPFDYVLYLVPMDKNLSTNFLNIINNVQVSTACSSVDILLSHYLVNVKSKVDAKKLILSSSDDYDRFISNQRQNNCVSIYDPLSLCHIYEYCEKVTTRSLLFG